MILCTDWFYPHRLMLFLESYIPMNNYSVSLYSVFVCIHVTYMLLCMHRKLASLWMTSNKKNGVLKFNQPNRWCTANYILCCVWTENWQKDIASIWGGLGPAVALMMFGSSIDTLPPARHTHSWLVLYFVFVYLCICILYLFWMTL